MLGKHSGCPWLPKGSAGIDDGVLGAKKSSANAPSPRPMTANSRTHSRSGIRHATTRYRLPLPHLASPFRLRLWTRTPVPRSIRAALLYSRLHPHVSPPTRRPRICPAASASHQFCPWHRCARSTAACHASSKHQSRLLSGLTCIAKELSLEIM
jgi:hypothetical protein